MPSNGNNGSKWIRKERRALIYHRDDYRCAWCLRKLSDRALKQRHGHTGWQAYRTLDHVIPRSKRGDHSTHNLLTSCKGCNELRGDLNAIEFATLLTQNEADPATARATILDRIIDLIGRPLQARLPFIEPTKRGTERV